MKSSDSFFPFDLDKCTTDIIQDVLSLVDIGVTTAEIEAWTRTQKVAALNWGYATHLYASDNVLNEWCRAHDEDADYDPPFQCICRPPMPDFLKPLRMRTMKKAGAA